MRHDGVREDEPERVEAAVSRSVARAYAQLVRADGRRHREREARAGLVHEDGHRIDVERRLGLGAAVERPGDRRDVAVVADDSGHGKVAPGNLRVRGGSRDRHHWR